jgi:outer membrane protein OmpA-like peptidoglycan-associated protein
MKNYYTTLLKFLIVSFVTFKTTKAQAQEARLKITPYIGLGLLLPEKQEIQSGSEQLTSLYSVTKIGSYLNADGTETSFFTSTNRIGASLGYQVFKNLELQAGANRTHLLHSYKYPFEIDLLNGFVVPSVTRRYATLNLTGGIKYNMKKYWIVANGMYTPDYSFFSQNAAATEDQRNGLGTGVIIDLNYKRTSLQSLYFAVGKKNILDLNVELGLMLNFQDKGYTDYSFYRNGSRSGSTRISNGTSSIFITVSQPINIGFNSHPKPPKPPKPEKTPAPKKTEDKKPAENVKKEYTFKDKVVFSGEDIVLNNIKFEQSKDILNLNAMKELDDVYDLMKKYEDTKVILTGHTSNEGNRKDNIALSKDRAEACKKYLVKKGIKSSRIKADGFGPDRPISNSNLELNRRVEIKIF